METKTLKTKKLLTWGTLTLGILSLFQVAAVLAVDPQTTFSQTISGSGTKSLAIVDANGDAVANPSASFNNVTFSFDKQTSTGTMGGNNEKIRVYNPTNSSTWGVTVAATGGPASVWDDAAGHTYDYNDTLNTGGDGDGDGIGGQLTIDATNGTLDGVAGCGTNNITKGTSTAFKNGIADSIGLLTAGNGAPTYCRFDFSGLDLSQVVPGNQTNGTYTMSFTVTLI